MEIFSLLGKIAVSNDEANENIEETTSKASTMGEKLQNGLEKVGKACVVAATAAATAVVALSKSSIEAYADYEQLTGGVETLFKNSASTIQDYADRAYQTAGLSANEYMETVTSFSASLLQSLGGDTAAAAEYADMAITDMADNANKMGSSMESIQNAYQGFAKQNYTMLDNLKLGYGGTQAEMERLIKDAAALDDSFKLCYDTNGELVYSYSDIVDAIHIVQTEMGITGTTAAEASETISGSIASMKGAWKNLLTALAAEDWDVGVYVSNLVDSVLTVAKNLMPRIQTLLPNISAGVSQLFTSLMPYITPMIETLLPGVIEGAIALLTALVVELPGILAILIEQIPSILLQIGTALTAAFPVLLETVKGLFGQIWDYIAVELLGTEADFETSFGVIQELFNGLWTVLQSLWDEIGQPIWEAIQECVGIVREVFSSRMSEIQEFVSTCFSDIQAFWTNNLQPCFQAIGEFIENVLAPTFESVFNGIIGPVIDTVFNFIKDIWENTLKPVFTGITDFLTGIFTGNWQQVWDGILSILTGIWNGIVTAISTAITLVWGNIVTVFTIVSEFISMIWTTIRDWLAEKISEIQENLAAKFEEIRANIEEKITAAKDKIVEIWTNIKEFVAETISNVKENLATKFEEIRANIEEKLTAAKDKITEIWTNIKEFVAETISNVKENLAEKFEQIRSNISEKLTAAKETVMSIWSNIRDGVANRIATMKENVTSKFDSIKSNITDKLTAAKETVTGIFDDIKSNISEKITAAKDKVNEVVEKIKSIFNFKWSFPSLKLPHVSVSGSFSLNPISYPKFSLSWYKKAMDNPMILDDPTIFGMSKDGQLLGGGEAGDEVVAGANTLMDMISAAVEQKTSEQTERLIAVMTAVLEAIESGNREMIQAMLAGHEIVWREREVARLVRTYA